MGHGHLLCVALEHQNCTAEWSGEDCRATELPVRAHSGSSIQYVVERLQIKCCRSAHCGGYRAPSLVGHCPIPSLPPSRRQPCGLKQTTN